MESRLDIFSEGFLQAVFQDVGDLGVIVPRVLHLDIYLLPLVDSARYICLALESCN